LNTFLSLTSAAITDMALIPNAVVAVGPVGAMPVGVFTRDAVQPTLVGFSVNMSSEQLWLTFDETVNASSLWAGGIRLQGNGSWSGCSFQLTGGVVLTDNDVVVGLQLVHEDVNAVKKLRCLFTRAENSFVSMAGPIVFDMAGNSVEVVGSNAAMDVNIFTADLVRPQLVSFDVSMDGNGSIVLTFDETVMASSFDPRGLELHNGANGSSYRLQGGHYSVLAADDSTVIRMTPLKSDLDSIKLLTDIFISRLSACISLIKL